MSCLTPLARLRIVPVNGTRQCDGSVIRLRLLPGSRPIKNIHSSRKTNLQMLIAKYSLRCLLLILAAVSLTLSSACTNTSSNAKPSYNNTQTSSTTTTHNEENPPPPATRSAQHSGTPQ